VADQLVGSIAVRGRPLPVPTASAVPCSRGDEPQLDHVVLSYAAPPRIDRLHAFDAVTWALSENLSQSTTASWRATWAPPRRILCLDQVTGFYRLANQTRKPGWEIVTISWSMGCGTQSGVKAGRSDGSSKVAQTGMLWLRLHLRILLFAVAAAGPAVGGMLCIKRWGNQDPWADFRLAGLALLLGPIVLAGVVTCLVVIAVFASHRHSDRDIIVR
jgi:hypothetical protein